MELSTTNKGCRKGLTGSPGRGEVGVQGTFSVVLQSEVRDQDAEASQGRRNAARRKGKPRPMVRPPHGGAALRSKTLAPHATTWRSHRVHAPHPGGKRRGI